MFTIWEILLVVVIVVLVFGVGKLGKVGANLGKAGRELKKELNKDEETPDSDLIDITPEDRGERRSKKYDPKPGRRKQPIEDAEVERET